MRHSDIRISSDIRIGCRIVEKNEAVTGRKGQQRQEMGSVISVAVISTVMGSLGAKQNAEMCL